MSNKPLHARLFEWIGNSYATLRFLYHKAKYTRRYPKYQFPYSQIHNGATARILANGPSLNNELCELLSKNIDLRCSVVVNYFATSDLFEQIKPMYYCLADPIFHYETLFNEKVLQLFTFLKEKVTWPMTLYVCCEGSAVIRQHIDNKNISILPIAGGLQHDGFENLRNFNYKKGYAVPSYVNVTIMAIYILLNQGYSTIELYGVDHSFLSQICTNDENELCVVDKHFYGYEYRKIVEIRDGIKWGVAEYIYNYYLTFVEHKRMRSYAEYLGAEIINCTKNSWIDAYTRLSQIEHK